VVTPHPPSFAIRESGFQSHPALSRYLPIQRHLQTGKMLAVPLHSTQWITPVICLLLLPHTRPPLLLRFVCRSRFFSPANKRRFVLSLPLLSFSPSGRLSSPFQMSDYVYGPPSSLPVPFAGLNERVSPFRFFYYRIFLLPLLRTKAFLLCYRPANNLFSTTPPPAFPYHTPPL